MNSKLLYSILFLKGRIGSDIKELATILKLTQKQTKEEIDILKEKLIKNKSSTVIKHTDDKIRLTISDETSKELSLRMDKTISVKLSKSVIETLTIIAYKQPIIKPEIERIRGVSSDYAISKLLEFDLVEDDGKSDLPGQPRLYITSPAFLELFNISNLKELPELPEDFESDNKEQLSLFNYDE